MKNLFNKLSQIVNKQLKIYKQTAICYILCMPLPLLFILYCNDWELAELLITLMWITPNIYMAYIQPTRRFKRKRSFGIFFKDMYIVMYNNKKFYLLLSKRPIFPPLGTIKWLPTNLNIVEMSQQVTVIINIDVFDVFTWKKGNINLFIF